VKENGFKFAPSEENKYKWLKDMKIDTVIDVGGHKGETVLKFHEILPQALIYSFEPLRDCYEHLAAISKKIPNAKAFNIALGDKKGKVNIYRSEYDASSSILKMGALHKEAFPFSSGERLELIEVDTLDEAMRDLKLGDHILLKIDVQGYELKVIAGAKSMIGRLKVIIVETSFYELYEEGPLFANIYDTLFKNGFAYSGCWSHLNSPLDGKPIQQDCIFLRE